MSNMTEKEKQDLQDMVFDLTYGAIETCYGMQKNEVIDCLYFGVNPQMTRDFLSLVKAGLTRYGLLEATPAN